jgi:hypothetical protein
MKKAIYLNNKNNTVPSWLILLVDLFIVACSIGLVMILRMNFKNPAAFNYNEIMIILLVNGIVTF